MRAVFLFLLLFVARECMAQDAGAPPLGTLTPRLEGIDANGPKPGQSRKSYLIPAIEIIGFEYALNRFDNRFIDPEEFDVSWESIKRNFKSRWVVDHDEFQTNQFLHPYQGSVYHTAARSTGHNFWTSAVYTFGGSALWEIAGETTPPSRNDQIATGIGGVFFGESLFRMASLTLERGGNSPNIWRKLGATGISPATGFNRMVFGERFDPVFPGNEPAFFTQWNLGATVAERSDGTSTESRHEARADFSLSYGLPGQPHYSYGRPFDYFNFEFTASSTNVFESILTRGMIAGEGYEVGNSYQGIWGIYGTYDYMAPQLFRVSNTGLALGTTGQWNVSEPVTLQGTFLGGVGYGAAGSSESLIEGRDYHYGLTPQALLAVRFMFGKVASLDLAGRGYQITRIASTQDRGWENIGRADAALTVRLFGPHSVTLKYLLTRRYAHYPGLETRDQRRGTLAVSYTLVGDRGLGAVR